MKTTGLVVAISFLVVLAPACLSAAGDSASDQVPDEPANTMAQPSASSADPVTAAPSTSVTPKSNTTTALEASDEPPTLEDLQLLVARTVELPRMSFEFDVKVTFFEDAVITHQTGSFDDNALVGVGSETIEANSAENEELFAEESYDFRFIDSTLWFSESPGEPGDWVGYDQAEFSDFAGADFLLLLDTDAIIVALTEMTTEVTEVQQWGDKTSTWVLLVPLDQFLPFVTTSGPAGLLVDLGLTETGLTGAVELNLDQDGFVTGFSARLDDWWTRSLKLTYPSVADALVNPELMWVSLRMETFDEPLLVEPPCQDPTRSAPQSGLSELLCEYSG